MANDKNDWRDVDVDAELTGPTRALYDAMKASYRQYAADKAAFEKTMNADMTDGMPEGMELKFGYMFGKLSVAIGPKRKAKAVKAQASGTLADWLANKAQGGHRS